MTKPFSYHRLVDLTDWEESSSPVDLLDWNELSSPVLFMKKFFWNQIKKLNFLEEIIFSTVKYHTFIFGNFLIKWMQSKID